MGSWQETEASLALRRKLGYNVQHVEGYRELATLRSHLVDMPTHRGLAYVPLDGIGATFTLVKASVHRDGANFPVVPIDGAIETEGFARLARKMGFEVVGVPGLMIFHVDEG